MNILRSRIRFSSPRRTLARSLFASAVALATVAAGPSAAVTSANAAGVVRDFKISVEAESTSYRGADAVLIRTISVIGRGASKTRPIVRCDQKACVRLATSGAYRKVVKKARVSFQNVNWILRSGQTFTIAIHQRKKIGRFRRMGLAGSGAPVMVVKKSGCVKRKFKRRRCPRNTALTPNDTPVSSPLPPREFFGFAGQWTFDWAPGAGTDLQPITGDFNGDGVDDIGLRRISSGLWYFRPGPNFATQWTFDWAPGAGTDLQPITGDFNGDGVDDIGLRRISSGLWYFRPGPHFNSQWLAEWSQGPGTDLQPITGDFNGDGVDDIGLRRVSSGLWYFRPGPSFAGQWTAEWSQGPGTDLQPITGDFNGDRTAEIGLRRVSSGMWYFRPGPGFGAQFTFDWSPGSGNDLQPLTGDFNGDGVDEIGLRRVSSGLWYFRPG